MTRTDVTTFTVDGDGGSPADEHNILLNSGDFRFRYASPNQRVFLVDTPVTYVCSGGSGGNIRRFSEYDIAATQPTNPAAAPLSAGNSAVLTTPVTACSFTYTPGTNQRAGLVTLDITVRDTASGDQVRLLHQVHVDNSP
jgi:MSHA biogenesis protein MshO